MIGGTLQIIPSDPPATMRAGQVALFDPKGAGGGDAVLVAGDRAGNAVVLAGGPNAGQQGVSLHDVTGQGSDIISALGNAGITPDAGDIVIYNAKLFITQPSGQFAQIITDDLARDGSELVGGSINMDGHAIIQVSALIGTGGPLSGFTIDAGSW